MVIDTHSLSIEELTAINPLDGRYRSKILPLSTFVSEYALIKTRFEIEIKYLIALSKVRVVRPLSPVEQKQLLKISDISLETARKVKELEITTRHDVKAMERVFRELVKKTSFEDIIEMIHIGITSEDVNNLSYRLMLKRASETILIPKLQQLLNDIVDKAKDYKKLPMLARTHGQPAIPTTLGKELAVFVSRLFKEITRLKNAKLTGKFSGAVGNFNALQLTYPHIDWVSFSENFVLSLDFEPNVATTQINTYEDIIAYFQIFQRINNILIDFNQDIWRYISDSWFVQVAKKGEIGSSTMPHKVNPIDFENSEGNLGLANSLIDHLTRKLPVSRLQRDLSDSTTIRNIGTILGYSFLSYLSTEHGLSRIQPNEKKIKEELVNNYAILGEAAQTVLRKAKISDPYSLLADLTKGEYISEKKWIEWIEKLSIPTQEKEKLKTLTPETYIGLSVTLCEKIVDEIQSAQK